MKILFSLYLIHKQDTLFDAVEFQWGYRENYFCAWWHMFNAFLSACAVALRTTYGKNNTHKRDTEGFIPVTILNGVVGFPSSFIRSLIGRTGKIWSVVYMNAKLIYASKTLACTIRECAIVLNVLHANLTYLFISWCSGAANVKWTLQVWNYSLNSAEVNYYHASSEILSNSHHQNSSIFSNLDWNISNLSITSSVEIFSMT